MPKRATNWHHNKELGTIEKRESLPVLSPNSQPNLSDLSRYRFEDCSLLMIPTQSSNILFSGSLLLTQFEDISFYYFRLFGDLPSHIYLLVCITVYVCLRACFIIFFLFHFFLSLFCFVFDLRFLFALLVSGKRNEIKDKLGIREKEQIQ